MPKTVYLPVDAERYGISITWVKSASRLDIGGWYDSFVDIPITSLNLREFFYLLGITKKDCDKAWGTE